MLLKDWSIDFQKWHYNIFLGDFVYSELCKEVGEGFGRSKISTRPMDCRE